MQNGKMTRDEAVALLRKLSSDDAFRTLFEKDPAAALKQIGFDNNEIAALPSSATKPESLPSKEQFQEALGEVLESGASDHVCMIVPFLKLTYGDAGGASRS
ncbi:MAG: NHLP-related RiPP peptide [Rhodanobacteraceae bacterium]